MLFLWKEFPDLSLSKKINAEKVSSFFIAIGSLLTAITIYLLYKQMKEQIEDRKAASRPRLYPERQFFALVQQKPLPKLTRDEKEDVLAGSIFLHNVGLGAAIEIKVNWRFQKNILAPMIEPNFVNIYSNRPTEQNYAFIPSNKQIDIQVPLMYLASLSSFKDGWSEMIWEELFLEITYKDIHNFAYSNKFKVVTYVGALYVLFTFSRVDSIILSNESSMISTELSTK